MRIGIDLGGTKIEGIAILADGTEAARMRVGTPQGDYEATVAAVAALVADIERTLDAQGTVGVGTPGAISPATGLMKNANSVVLNGRPVDADLEAALGRRVRLANDADCLALSEAVDGAAAGSSNVFGVIIGTGVGGGVVVGGRLVAGPNAITGEWGHNQLPYVGSEDEPVPACYCGRAGCVETYVSGPALERDHLMVTGIELKAYEIAARRATDEAAMRTMERYADRFARAVSAVLNILDPEVVVLGGGLSNIDWLYTRVPELWGQYVFSDRVATRLVRNHHGDASGVRGAAWLWPDSA
ncbi:MAG: ROK family protein [Acidimicrobiia bacterium]|nr:ROK family protein [Acidimicrobiia bacterium]